jgi:Xaa-Pro aminopeptidase
VSGASPYLPRIAAVREVLQRRSLPAILVTNSVNLGWVCGFTGSNGFALITSKDAIFATDSRYTDQARAQCPDFTLELLPSSAPEEVTGLLEKLAVPAIAFEADSLTVSQHTVYRNKLSGNIELVPTTGLVSDLRMVKDTGEISAIEAAVAIADRTWEHILPYLKPGAAERDVMLEMDRFIRHDCGAEIAFDFIVASGPRSALPHGRASNRTMGAGEFVTLDFGARLDNYNSDITRTVVLGEPTTEQRKIYQTVRDTLYRSIERIKPSADGRELHMAAVQEITDAGYGQYFGHGLGHGLGRAVHDHPAFSIRSETRLREGMVVTVEPGIYIPGQGGVRLEHDVLVTASGARILDQSKTDLLTL